MNRSEKKGKERGEATRGKASGGGRIREMKKERGEWGAIGWQETGRDCGGVTPHPSLSPGAPGGDPQQREGEEGMKEGKKEGTGWGRRGVGCGRFHQKCRWQA